MKHRKPADQRAGKLLQFLVTEDEMRQIEAMAAAEGRTKAGFARHTVMLAVRELPQKPG